MWWAKVPVPAAAVFDLREAEELRFRTSYSNLFLVLVSSMFLFWKLKRFKRRIRILSLDIKFHIQCIQYMNVMPAWFDCKVTQKMQRQKWQREKLTGVQFDWIAICWQLGTNLWLLEETISFLGFSLHHAEDQPPLDPNGTFSKLVSAGTPVAIRQFLYVI